MASSAQAKPQHLPLWLLTLITTLFSISHATEMNNFSKFSRQNLVPQTKQPSDTNKPQESTTYGDMQFEEVNTQQPPYSDDNALRDWQFEQWNKHQLEKQRLKAQSRPAQNDQQPYPRASFPRYGTHVEEGEDENSYRNVYSSDEQQQNYYRESNDESPMTSSSNVGRGRWDPSGFESNSFGWRRREPQGRERIERQGMSDTRFLHGGIFHYDLRTEKFNENHPYNRMNQGTGLNSNGMAGRFDDRNYVDMSAGVNGYKDNQYQNHYENQFQEEKGEEEP